MALPQGKIKNMASSLAAMGNLGSSTLDEILQTSQRFASSAGLAKLDPSAVFAYANAVTSLGQQAEAGGSSLMKTFDKVDSAVNKGGDALKQYANVAGMTSAQFVKAYRQDAGAAVQQFFAGLSKQSKVAGEADKILTALGITEVREKQAVLNLANGHNLLAGALKESSRAYEAADEHQKKAEIAATSLQGAARDGSARG
jgi:TP901 family phage tail tape measure protein